MPNIPQTDSSAFACDACGKKFRWKPELAGKRMACKCGTTLRVPMAPIGANPAPSTPTVRPPARKVAAVAQKPIAKPAAKPVVEEDEENYDLADLAPTQDQLAPAPMQPASRAASSTKSSSPNASGGGMMDVVKKVWASVAGGKKEDEEPTHGQRLAGFYIYGVGVAALCVILAGVFYVLDQQHAAFVKVAQQTQGEVVDTPDISKSGRRASQRNNPDNWTFTFPVTYTVDGQSFRNEVKLKGDHLPTGFDAESSGQWVGRSISLAYDPADPNHVEASLWAKYSSWTVAYGVCGIFFCYGAYQAFKRWPY